MQVALELLFGQHGESGRIATQQMGLKPLQPLQRPVDRVIDRQDQPLEAETRSALGELDSGVVPAALDEKCVSNSSKSGPISEDARPHEGLGDAPVSGTVDKRCCPVNPRCA